MKNVFSALGLAAVMAGAATTAQAQSTISFGPRVGGNLSTVAISGEDADGANPKQIVGFQLGVTADIQLATNFALQPSLLFSQKGFKLEESGSYSANGITATYSEKRTLKVNYVELPLNFVYTSGGDHGLQVFAGPYLALGVGGSLPYESSINIPGVMNEKESGTGTIKFADQEPSNMNGDEGYVRRLDAGFNGGVGYRQGPFQVQFGYGLGLGNLVPKDSQGNDQGITVRNRVLQLSANYFFGGK